MLFRSLEEIRAKAAELQIHLPFGADTHVLREKVSFGNVTLENRMGIAPMEGADGLPDGSPSELTLRRYVREAEGASGMIWFEAISIVPEGRSGAHQLMLTRDNLENYKSLLPLSKRRVSGPTALRLIWSCRPITAAATPTLRAVRRP